MGLDIQAQDWGLAHTLEPNLRPSLERISDLQIPLTR